MVAQESSFPPCSLHLAVTTWRPKIIAEQTEYKASVFRWLEKCNDSLYKRGCWFWVYRLTNRGSFPNRGLTFAKFDVISNPGKNDFILMIVLVK